VCLKTNAHRVWTRGSGHFDSMGDGAILKIL